MEESRQEYKKVPHNVKREVPKDKQKAYEELYERLDSKEGENDLCYLAKQSHQAGKISKVSKDRVEKFAEKMERVF